MRVENGTLLGGEEYVDYLVEDGTGAGFAARLIGQNLEIDWTGSPGTTMAWLAKVQEIAGGPGTIEEITGYATDTLGEIIKRGEFDPERAARGLNKSLGGQWKVNLWKEGTKTIIRARRIGD